MFHLMKVHDAETKNISYETNRSNFIGRGNSIHNPQVMNRSNTLTDTEGSVLDPIISIRYRIVIEPQETIIADLIFVWHEVLHQRHHFGRSQGLRLERQEGTS